MWEEGSESHHRPLALNILNLLHRLVSQSLNALQCLDQKKVLMKVNKMVTDESHWIVMFAQFLRMKAQIKSATITSLELSNIMHEAFAFFIKE